ncbi:MAG TPA: hypothetical protein VFI46_12470, partial [Jiangellaceae bacterium]|nr:hypothetical protein [Jiangellaceae bacterium]
KVSDSHVSPGEAPPRVIEGGALSQGPGFQHGADDSVVSLPSLLLLGGRRARDVHSMIESEGASTEAEMLPNPGSRGRSQQVLLVTRNVGDLGVAVLLDGADDESAQRLDPGVGRGGGKPGRCS